MSTDVGKVFEKELEKVFDILKDSHLLGWHRFPDTAAAGGAILQQQPSDYLLGLPPGSAVEQRLFFVEAKASESHSSLKLDMIQASQRGAIHQYGNLLKIPYFIVFWDVVGGRIELWDGVHAIKRGRGKKPIRAWSDISVRRMLKKEQVAHLFKEEFQLPEAAVTIRNYEE